MKFYVLYDHGTVYGRYGEREREIPGYIMRCVILATGFTQIPHCTGPTSSSYDRYTVPAFAYAIHKMRRVMQGSFRRVRMDTFRATVLRNGSSVLNHGQRRAFGATKSDLVVSTTTTSGVTTLRMNRPKKLNGWTEPMLLALFDAFKNTAADVNTKAVVLTGTGDYYCAGVDLGGTIKPMHPQSLFDKIRIANQQVFDTFIDFPKPLVVAANGPAIGASVTSATLSDGIVASDRATFSTPFARLGVTPEGCSSVHFERIMGAENAAKMLEQNWKPDASEALSVGLIDEVVPHEELLDSAVAYAEKLISEGRDRRLKEKGLYDEYKEVNKKESVDLANAFLSEKFLSAQRDFAASRKKSGPARLFSALLLTRPLWINMVKSP